MIEIERKFLIKNLPALKNLPHQRITQGFATPYNPEFVFRLRQSIPIDNKFRQRAGIKYFQTIKKSGLKKRIEVEIEITSKQMDTLWELCNEYVVTKSRYSIPIHDGFIAEVDVYKNDLAGLITVEVEFTSEELANSFIPPDWFGEEITENKNYTNVALAFFGLPK